MTDLQQEEKLASVRTWALRQAERSEKPWEFLERFDRYLREVRRDSKAVDRYRPRTDPVYEAAEIEALSAARALERWGTGRGLCHENIERRSWPL